MKLVQIIGDRVHWVSPYTKDDLYVSVNVDEDGNDIIEPRFAPDIIFVEAPDHVQERYFYDSATETFTSPDDMHYYAQLNESYEVIYNDMYSKNELEASEYLIKVNRTTAPPIGYIYYGGEFMNQTQYISKRFDKLEELLKQNLSVEERTK